VSEWDTMNRFLDVANDEMHKAEVHAHADESMTVTWCCPTVHNTVVPARTALCDVHGLQACVKREGECA
jgi:hypothetical protein